MILLRVGNRNFYFANSSGAFPENENGHKRSKNACDCQLKHATQRVGYALVLAMFLLKSRREI